MTNELLADCRRMAAAVAPEVSPLYFLDALPPSLPWPDRCGGFAQHQTFPALREQVEQAGQWRGPGAIIALRPAVLCRGHNDPAAVLLASTAHELAHLLPHRPATCNLPASAELVTMDRAYHVADAIAPTAPQTPPWLTDGDHGAQFIRRAIHVACRAWRAGFVFALPDVTAAGPEYGLSPLLDYADALADEPERLAGLTFDEIEATEPPRAFTDLFTRDTENSAHGN